PRPVVSQAARRRKRAGAPLDLRPAWEIAFERLALLQQRNLAGQEKYKEYYFELTEIARAYLGRMYAINALDMTTEEFLDRFQKEELPPDLCDGVDRFLHHADLVKFARFIPQRERAETDFTFVYGIIEEVRADYQRRQAALLAVQAGSGKAGAVGAAAGSAQT
ncbi:MAG TPA: hypothetical protein VN285_05205, partial [Candidatus Deferrimicrobium sp.]|nr:hypothetical protein [Candidatus Deferrimicrobium sp.]